MSLFSDVGPLETIAENKTEQKSAKTENQPKQKQTKNNKQNKRQGDQLVSSQRW